MASAPASDPTLELGNRLRSVVSPTAPETWLVTGAAGFIGSHLVEWLLSLGQRVVAFDDFSTGRRSNLEAAVAAAERAAMEPHAAPASPVAAAERLHIVEGTITDRDAVAHAAVGAHRILHQAALASVPGSIEDPVATHEVNVTGWLHVLEAARRHGARRIVYASSSAVYGDAHDPPLAEDRAGDSLLLSPYAGSKRIDEILAGIHGRVYGIEAIGLRYFNIFGPRQDPGGAYAAVIPRWTAAMLNGEPITIHGDGETTRDFCHVADVVQANLLAATTADPEAPGQVCNVGLGQRTSLNELFARIRDEVQRLEPGLTVPPPVHDDFRRGDIRHSHADIAKARRLLGFAPSHPLAHGLASTVAWFRDR